MNVQSGNVLTWLDDQLQRGVAQFDEDIINYYPDKRDGAYLADAEAYLERIGGFCNYIQATELVAWDSIIPAHARVLDLGCGGGWLAAILSRRASVDMVFALDSSRFFLQKMLPDVFRRCNAQAEKLTTIHGLLYPLLFQDAYLDLVVASSALHHAESMEAALKEIRRTLRKNGVLVVLNETPAVGWRHLLSVSVAFVRIFRNLCTQRYMPSSPAISSSGYLYDPKLGDRDYPRWYWEKAIRASGFVIESVMDTGLPTVKGRKGRSLIHFVCRAA